ncbi:hypothetical protein [Candidatus Binatus soli]|jgi:hypothetical protein|uniref:hypothetical protein n=1 Tax=Candidatus Binatus soli TaxID=1953413 RepID=UPI003D0F7AB2
MKRLLAACFGLLMLARCGSEPGRLPVYHDEPRVRGSVCRVEHVAAYPAVALRLFLWFAGVREAVPVSHGIDLYRISYWSMVDGRSMLLSGLMVLPESGPLRGTVLYMHGTNVDRRRSVSNPSFEEGVLVSGVFAGGGYLHLAPDLLGLGISKGVQPYFYNPGTIDQTLDFLRAAQTVSKDLGRRWNADIYITGFSQGGHASAVIQHALEGLGNPSWHVIAGAGIAGPYDVADIALPLAMTGAASGDSLYLTNLALCYSTYYRQPLESVLKPERAAKAGILLDGDHADDLAKSLPTNPRELFTPEFLTAFDRKQPHWFLNAARENEAYAWAPKAPFRAYYGDKDVDVAPENAKFFVREALSRGGHVEAVSVGPEDHNGTAYHSIPRIRRWFDDLSAPSNASH